MSDHNAVFRGILAEELNDTPRDPAEWDAALRAMSRAYDRGRFDQRVEDDLRSPAGRSSAG